MSRLDFVENTTTTTAAPLPLTRKLANKERRKVGRERHEERKEQHKALTWNRRWQSHEHEHQHLKQQKQTRDDSNARALTGRNLDFHRNVTTDDGNDADDDAPDCYYYHEQHEEKGKGREGGEEELVVPQEVASGAMLLAMARPAKTRHGRRGRPHYSPLAAMTDGEAFEVIEVDGRLVVLDEDGWEILPDENAEAAFVLYSDIVRGIVR